MQDIRNIVPVITKTLSLSLRDKVLKNNHLFQVYLCLFSTGSEVGWFKFPNVAVKNEFNSCFFFDVLVLSVIDVVFWRRIKGKETEKGRNGVEIDWMKPWRKRMKAAYVIKTQNSCSESVYEKEDLSKLSRIGRPNSQRRWFINLRYFDWNT